MITHQIVQEDSLKNPMKSHSASALVPHLLKTLGKDLLQSYFHLTTETVILASSV